LQADYALRVSRSAVHVAARIQTDTVLNVDTDRRACGEGAATMRLTRITIVNHSRLFDTELEIRGHVVLVGPNDVGKSSLLRCLDLVLGASTAQLYQRVVLEDFRDHDQPLVIEAELRLDEARVEKLLAEHNPLISAI
jgi:ATPase subunit of ABC transporter with duplicated ATPase domains